MSVAKTWQPCNYKTHSNCTYTNSRYVAHHNRGYFTFFRRHLSTLAPQNTLCLVEVQTVAEILRASGLTHKAAGLYSPLPSTALLKLEGFASNIGRCKGSKAVSKMPFDVQVSKSYPNAGQKRKMLASWRKVVPMKSPPLLKNVKASFAMWECLLTERWARQYITSDHHW